jgi:hypothetical protein
VSTITSVLTREFSSHFLAQIVEFSLRMVQEQNPPKMTHRVFFVKTKNVLPKHLINGKLLIAEKACNKLPAELKVCMLHAAGAAYG